MSGGKFELLWNSQFKDAVPVGRIMKKDFQKRSFRIHNLPESKKNPENDEDKEEILHRHNWVNNYVLANNTPCYIALSVQGEDDLGNYGHLEWLSDISIIETIETTFHNGDDYDVMTTSVGEITWSEGEWDKLIIDVAENNAPSVLIMSQNNARVYAPYFGGADIFMESDMLAEGMASQFSEWLSPYDPRKD